MPRYCALYERLQRAGSELFGPRAAFTLALHSGFSGALLQQSFLTTTHVSPTAFQAAGAVSSCLRIACLPFHLLLLPILLHSPFPLHRLLVPFPLRR